MQLLDLHTAQEVAHSSKYKQPARLACKAACIPQDWQALRKNKTLLCIIYFFGQKWVCASLLNGIQLGSIAVIALFELQVGELAPFTPLKKRMPCSASR